MTHLVTPKHLSGLGLSFGLLCSLPLLAAEDVALFGLGGMFLAGLVVQIIAGLRATRTRADAFRHVIRSTIFYWVAASVGFAVGMAVVFTSVLAPDAPSDLVIEQSLVGLPLLWAIAAVCGAVVAAVTSAVRAITVR